MRTKADCYSEKVTKKAPEEKSIKVIEFTGTDFKIWSKKFVALANRKGYKGLLEGTGHKNQECPKHQTGRDQNKF